jgi:hypothetical protein
MDHFEIKLGFINRNTIIFLIIFIVFALVLVVPLYSKLVELGSCTSCDQTPLIIVCTTVIGIFVGLLVAALSFKNRKIRVDKNLIYFMKKPLFNGWVTEKVIDFLQVIKVKDRKESHFTGKATVIYYYLIFELRDGSKQELFVNGYDFAGIKNLFFYVRGKYPDVKFDNDLFRDSSEKLSGLNTL